MRALYIAATGMSAQQFNLDVIANNLANVNTAGFKQSRAEFQDLLYQTVHAPGVQMGQNAQLPVGSQIGLGVTSGATAIQFTQGALRTTGGNYDIAINGDGFFQILMPDGTLAYTRDGQFSVDSTGKLVTSQGYALQPEIVIPQDMQTVTISPDGIVSVTRAGQTNPDQIGQIQLTRFINPQGLMSLGSNLYAPTQASGTPITDVPSQSGLGTLIQGSIEGSNVNIVNEMIDLIMAQRAYESNSKAIQTADQMLTTANQIKQ
ncbi:MAG: flagellar basal-body rod protein FlgG [Armatimonadetes bacterium]|nr:flagellar basal-body rod protein FlgG [Armatimonadota bacterium]